MKHLLFAFVLISALLVGATAFGQEPAPKKYLLKEVPLAVGDVIVIARRSSTDVQLRAVPEGSREAVVDAPMVYKVQEKYTDSVLGVSGGKPIHYTRRYAIAKNTTTARPGDDPRTAALPRQGKTLTVRLKGNAVTVTSGKDKLPAAEIATLKRELLPGQDVNPYPEHEVGPGDEWTKEGKDVLKQSGGGVAKLQAKFVDIVDYEGHPCARISVRMEVENRQGGLPLLVKLTGEVMHALDIHRDLSANLSGEVSVDNKLTQNGVTVEVTGLGTASLTQTEVWLKRRGKPVPKKSAAPPKITPPSPAPETAPQ